MATLYAVQAALQNDPKMGNRGDGLKVSGNLHIAQCVYVNTGSEATNDVLKLVKLPDRAMVIPQLCSVRHEAMGTAYSVTVGDADEIADADRYSTAIALAAAGQTAFSADGVAGLTPYAITDPAGAWVQAVLSSVTTPTAAKKLVFFIAYVIQV